MNFYLDNNHRKCMGLKPLDKRWDLVKIKKGEFEEYYIFFDKDTIKKIIKYFVSPSNISMEEMDLNYETTDNRQSVLPKTSRGKIRKLSGTTVDSFDGEGNYFFITYEKQYDKAWVIIGNYTNQRSYYEEKNIKNCKTLEDFKVWCDKFVSETTKQDIQDVQKFIKEPRKHVKYKEGDYFVFKLGRREYGYGQLLFDINKFNKERKKGKYKERFRGFDLMHTPVLVRVFKIITENDNLTINEIKKLEAFPSEIVLDNKLYYGEWRIIGNEPIDYEKVDFPIQFGFYFDTLTDGKKIVYLQKGFKYLEVKYNEISNELKELFNNAGLEAKYNEISNQLKEILNNAGLDAMHKYAMDGVGFYLDIERFLEEFREIISNNDTYYKRDDLRDSKNSGIKEMIYKNLNVDWD